MHGATLGTGAGNIRGEPQTDKRNSNESGTQRIQLEKKKNNLKWEETNRNNKLEEEKRKNRNNEKK